jgi:hypothetical protein
MKSKITLIIAALLLSLSAAAEMITHTEAYELAASSVRLPATEGGTIAFKTCSKCDYQVIQLRGNTVWNLNGNATTLTKFRAAMAGITNRDSQLVIVKKNLADKEVTEVVLWVR